MLRSIRIYGIVLLAAMAASCSQEAITQGEFPATAGPVYPDYMGVTVPVGIAPLNFCYTAPGLSKAQTTFSCGKESFSVKGVEVRIPERKWRRLLQAARGSEITVSSSVADTVWTISVCEDEIDYGLTYRLLEPGYEVYSKMGIYERELGSFKERALIENTEFSGCVNCHATNRGDPSQYSLHIRGDHGATLLKIQGSLDAYNTKTDSTLGFCVYPYWHPAGDYIAYSTNSTRQGFHVQQDKLIEVFDLDSDLQVYDIRHNCLITAPQIKEKAYWETFPSFSPDGKTLYFCRAVPKAIPENVTDIRYSFCKVSFDAATGTIGDDVEVLIDAEDDSLSVCFPKPSYDGRYVVYTKAAYGNFSIWHHESDLWMLDLQTGERTPLNVLNSADTESYHNFSSNGRWFQFASRRDDGLFTRIYISHFDPETGEFGKPFMLPQKHPRTFYRSLFLSYNVTEFSTGPVQLDKVRARKIIASPERVPFGFRWSE